jgi:hypothetical protein
MVVDEAAAASDIRYLMVDCIDKESWCKDKYHGDKFHHKNVNLKRCPGCGDRNPDFINDYKDDLSDADKDSEESRCFLNPNRERFTRVSNNADLSRTCKARSNVVLLDKKRTKLRREEVSGARRSKYRCGALGRKAVALTGHAGTAPQHDYCDGVDTT